MEHVKTKIKQWTWHHLSSNLQGIINSNYLLLFFIPKLSEYTPTHLALKSGTQNSRGAQGWNVFLEAEVFQPLTPKSDKQVVSPNSITLESHIKVTRIQEMIPNSRNSWLDKSSL